MLKKIYKMFFMIMFLALLSNSFANVSVTITNVSGNSTAPGSVTITYALSGSSGNVTVSFAQSGASSGSSSTTKANNGTYTKSFSNLAAGTHYIYVGASQYGSTSQTSTSFTVTSPPPPTVSLTVSGGSTEVGYAKLRYTINQAGTVTIYGRGTTLYSGNKSAGSFNYYDYNLTAGTYYYDVTIDNSNGSASASGAWTVNSPPPPSVSITSITGNPYAPGSATINYYMNQNATVYIYHNGSNIYTTGNNSGNYSYTVNNLAAGTHNFQVSISNPNGSASDSDSYIVYQPLDISVTNITGDIITPGYATLTYSLNMEATVTPLINGVSQTSFVKSAGTHTYTTGTLTTGTYTIELSATAGSQSDSDQESITIGTPPTVIIQSITGNQIAPGSANIVFNISEGSRYQIYQNNSLIYTSPGYNYAGTLSHQVTNLSEGTFTFKVEVDNIYGVGSDTETWEVDPELDITITNINGDISEPGYARLYYTLNKNATIAVEINGLQVDTFPASAGNLEYQTTSLNAGTYTIKLTATLGSESDSDQRSLTIGRTPVVTFGERSGSHIYPGSVNFTFNLSDESRYKIYRDTDLLFTSPGNNYAGTLSYTINSLQLGLNTIKVVADNVYGEGSSEFTWEVNPPPPAIVINQITGTHSEPDNIVLNYTIDQTADIEIKKDSDLFPAIVDQPAGTYDYPINNLPEGNYVFSIKAHNSNGENTVTSEWIVNPNPHSVKITNITGKGYEIDTITINYTLGEPGTVRFLQDGTQITETGLPNGPHSYIFYNIAKGSHIFKIETTNSHGDFNDSVSWDVTAHPSSVYIDDITGTNMEPDSVTVFYTLGKNSLVTIYRNNVAVWENNKDAGQHTYGFSDVMKGSYYYKVRARNTDGDFNDLAEWVVEQNPHGVNIQNITGSHYLPASAEITYYLGESSTVTIMKDGETVYATGQNNGGPYYYTFSDLSKGMHNFKVKVVNSFGEFYDTKDWRVYTDPNGIDISNVSGSHVAPDDVIVNFYLGEAGTVDFYDNVTKVYTTGQPDGPGDYTFQNLDNGSHVLKLVTQNSYGTFRDSVLWNVGGSGITLLSSTSTEGAMSPFDFTITYFVSKFGDIKARRDTVVEYEKKNVDVNNIYSYTFKGLLSGENNLYLNFEEKSKPGYPFPEGYEPLKNSLELTVNVGLQKSLKTITYAYNHLGALVSESINNEVTYAYSYDNQGRLHEAKSQIGAGAVVTDATYTYTAADKVDLLTYNNISKTVDYNYQPNTGWLQSIGGNNAFAATNTYYNNGNINQITFNNNGVSGIAGYTYDNQNRLTNMNITSAVNIPVADRAETYAYNSDGAFTSKNRTGNVYGYTYESVQTNRLASVTYNGATKQFKYDARGNVTYDGLSGVCMTEYERRNLPLKMAVQNDGVDTLFYKYGYNDGGNRIIRESKDSMERYLYDASGRTVAVYDINTNAMKYAYLYGNDMIGKIDFSSTPERFYNVKDHLGSTRLVYDESGTVVDRMDYFPYGEFLGTRQFTGGTSEGDTKFHFTGKENDFETGYHYFGARYYNKYLGLWNSVDPLVCKYPGWSPFNYTLGNPINRFDPNGKEVHQTKELRSNYMLKCAMNLMRRTNLGNELYNKLNADKSIYVVIDIVRGNYNNLGSTVQFSKMESKSFREQGQTIPKTGGDINVNLKDGQKAIRVLMNINGIKNNNLSIEEISRVMYHELKAHIDNDPNNNSSESNDHQKYGEATLSEGVRPGSQADDYKKQVEENATDKEKEKNE